MKFGNSWKRFMALLLVAAMTMSLAACASSDKGTAAKPQNGEISLQAGDQTVTLPEEPEEMTREEKELVAELMGGCTDTEGLSDEELDAIINGILETVEPENNTDLVNLSNQKKPPEVTENPGAYDENGAMTAPFDQVYPEYIEQEYVTFSGESILIKLASNKLTDGLKAAGIGAVEVIVPMENCAWYEAKLKEGTSAEDALAAVRQLKEVLLAEYNYEIQTAALDDYKHFDDKTDKEFQKNGHNKDQWHQHHCGIPDGYEEMETEGGDSSVVVAVIDSGVDYDHEDLIDNMWVNAAEIPDNGRDDDKNGYVDDYYGIDLVAGKGSADDDNGHGTHVAGIIAGVNNNTGIVGIAYNVKIMPIKAAMHNGTLNQANIAKAILYAYEMGAEVINMSFGGTACSIAVQDALAVAYTRCVLVASAGNSGKPNQESDYMAPLPNYPAALSYVLGVMSVDENGMESAFTNWDTYAYNGVEYEVYAPGENIMSTLPDNRYGYLSGTSMAAPIVSSFAAILRSEFSDRDMYPTKFIYGQLASTSNYSAECIDPEAHVVDGKPHNLPQIVNLEAALTKLPKPEVNLNDYAIFDSKDLSPKNNGDGVIDAGETIALGLTLRNRWGMSENTLVTIDTLENGIADPYVTIVNPTVDYGSVGTYSTGDCGKIYTDGLHTGWENPFIIKIADNCPNDYRITFHVTITCENALDENDNTVYERTSDIDTAARNGVVLPSIIEEDMVLTSDNLYIIPNATVIQEGVTVRVQPGTHVQFWSNDANDPYAQESIAFLRVEGKFLVEGTREEPVYIYPSQLMSDYIVDMGEANNGVIRMQYADITNLCKQNMSDSSPDNSRGITYAYGCTFRQNTNDPLRIRYMNYGILGESLSYDIRLESIELAERCVFYKLGCNEGQHITDSYGIMLWGTVDTCIFVDCDLRAETQHLSAKKCVFLGNVLHEQNRPDVYGQSTLTVKPWQLPEKRNIEIYYRAETGTTYVVYQGHYLNSQRFKCYLETIAPVEYAIMETQEELDWVVAEYLYNRAPIQMGITKDPATNEFLWSDGSSVAEFLLPDEPSELQGGFVPNITSNGKLTTTTSYDYFLFEIQGQVLPTEITFREYAVDIDMEGTYQIVPLNNPVQLPENSFLYESTDAAVITVSESGVVTPVGKGTADVWVYSLDKAVKNRVSFTVKDYVALDSLSLSASTAAVAVGECATLNCVFTPANTTRKNVTYTISNPAVAVVENGILTGISSGTVYVTATCEGISATTTVTVYTKTTALDIPNVTVVMTAGGSATLPKVITSEGAEPDLYWSSTDEAVLEIIDGQPIPHKAGTTTLIVTDLRSGLSDSVDVYVLDKSNGKVVDIQPNYALLEDGSLYNWSSNRQKPILNGIKSFAYASDSGCLFLLMQDGSLSAYKHGEHHPISTEGIEGNVVDIWAYIPYTDRDDHDDYWVVTDSGAAYYIAGVSGVPVKMQFNEPIKSIDGNHYRLAVIAESGNLYYTNYGKLDTTPKLIARNVTYANMGYYDICYISNNRGYTYDTENDTYYETVMDYSECDQVFIDPAWYSSSYYSVHHALVAKDGTVSVVNRADYGYGAYETWDILTDVDPVALYGFGLYRFGSGNNSGVYVATSDGVIYSISNTIVPIVLGIPAETLTITDTNLTKDGVLEENTLRIKFNKKLAGASAKLYENGTPIATTVTHSLNTLTVSTKLQFVEGVEYTLVISAADTYGYGNLTLPEDLQIRFTYVSGGAAEDQPSDGVTEDAAPVVYESLLDNTVERILTVDSLRDKLNAYIAKEQFNPAFTGNAILNYINTDDNTAHWFRPTADTADKYVEIPFGGNYWGTSNEKLVGLQIVDYADFPNSARLQYAPYLTEAPENTFPFVTAVKLFNKNGEAVTTVGNEEITFQVKFNRDMDTTIPLQVRFGSAYPYGDYEIEGQYVDARTWEGTYTLNTLIENGNQFFTIANGCSATEDLELQMDQKRFGFVIDTTAAQALIMQGTATDTGIELRWTQDDFDTLMGYNIYRSTAEDGLYTRINKTVIPADTMTFFDDTVEPGVVYYYNFTVVKTDLTESEPSGKITIMSKDTMAPNIYHSPVSGAFTGSNLVISATITDNLNIAYANLYYRVAGTDSWNIVRMNKLNDKYSAIIPAQYVTLEGLEYYFEAFDGVSYTYKGTAEAPFTVTVQASLDTDALGDVDGDGTITNLDALLLLYAINDKYNLTAEEFARADLNGDGVLWAAEALRILQYVSGTVGSVKL